MFVAYRRDVIGRHIARYGAHEAALTGWIGRHLERSPKGIFVDVGAHIGWHTIHAARHAAVETIVAFEPDAFNAWLLGRNLSMNNVDNVVVCAWALGSGPGMARLHSHSDRNLGRHSLIANYGLGARLVPLLTLDGTLDNLGLGDKRILALKIDVEGYEPAVIAGTSRALARTDVVIHEFTPNLSRDGGLSVKEMIDQLHRCGFKPFALASDGSLTPFEDARLRSFEGQTDVIWTR